MHPVHVRRREAALASFLLAFAFLDSLGGHVLTWLGLQTGHVGGLVTIVISAVGGFAARKAWLAVTREGDN